VTYERVEIVTSAERRRRWPAQEKLRLVAESYRADGGIAEVAGRVDLHPSLLQRWRRQVRDGTLAADRLGPGSFVPIAIGEIAGPVPAPLTAPLAPGQGLVEIELPNGCRVRVGQDIPAAALRRIVGVLARR
jgi:transposase-like protein